MPRAVRKCRNCGKTITWKGDGRWQDEKNSSKCEGYARGHQPSNSMRKKNAQGN